MGADKSTTVTCHSLEVYPVWISRATSDIKLSSLPFSKVFPQFPFHFPSIQTPLNSLHNGGSFSFISSANYLLASPVYALSVSVFFFLFSFIQVSPLAVQSLLLCSKTQCHYHSPDQAARGSNVVGRSTLVG